ncbi:cobaltochelatase subunit CobN [uncultured Dialister sp.]|uniref:cobaltochelatase subunit CobN n=1 Tax=uncultured Dialister sp. TaxID=278064 RepID=UPI0025F7DE21|nr:cobaltochelatase subunit CobN [uncultured Dialister sp.]
MDIKIVYMTNHDRRYAAIRKACDLLQEDGRISDLCIPVFLEKTSDWNFSWERKMKGSSLVMVHLMKNALKSSFWQDCKRYLDQHGIPYFVDAVDEGTAEHSESITDEMMKCFREYCLYGGMENFKNLWLYANSLFDPSIEKPEKPEPFAWSGIYDRGDENLFTTDRDGFLERYCTGNKPVIGLLFYREEWIWGDLAYQNAFIDEAEKQGYHVIPAFANASPDTSAGMPTLMEVLDNYFMKDGKPVIDALVSTMKFSLTGTGKASLDKFKELGVPLLDAYTLLVSEKEWRDNKEGLNSIETSIAAAMPELDGFIHGVPIAGRVRKEDGTVEFVPILERIGRMVSKAGKWASLHRLQNKDKKIAIIFHNYPAKNSNIGSASGLDTMESTIRLMNRMKEEGYTIDFIPESTDKFIELMTSHATNDISMMTEEQAEECQKLSAKEYIDFFHTLGGDAQKRMEDEWGKAPGEVMISEKGNILVPGTMDGNLFLTVQPSRQYGMDPSKAYHDPYIAPTHQYLAFYYWLRNVWKADAVIHMGTHGNLEWLPGKSVGLDEESYPDIALGDLPNIYPYHMTITGEGMIAKRRAAGCLIGYMPAPVSDAGAYDEISELEKTMDEYAHLKETGNDVSDMEKPLLELVQKAKLENDVPRGEDESFDDYVSDLHNYIEELKDSEVHVGLHILGQPLEGDLLIDGILQLLRLSNEKIPSIYDLWAEKYDTTLDTIQTHASEIDEAQNCTYSELMSRIRKETRKVIETLNKAGFNDSAAAEAMNLPETEGTESWRVKLKQLLDFVITEIYPRIAKTTQELDHTLDALDGRYVEPGPSGSPNAGGVNLLPSGRNFYGVDPRTMPSPAGWQLGVKLGDRMIEKFIADQGKYPENIGMVLWSGPNMRSSGQDIAEFLYMLGVRPVWQKGSLRINGLEIIPLKELKRPRIDVTGRISGLFRDTLPQLAELMDDAVLLAASQDESDEDNFVRKHIKEDTKMMTDEGVDADDAWRNAAFRIFGDAPGTYGAGVNTVLDSKNWQNENDLASIYVRWGGHVFGGGNRGTFKPELFKKRLASLDLTVKNEENHESNILSSDDYNAFHGGMIAAVKSLGGKTPQSYVGDSTNRSAVGVKTVQEEMKRVFRTESMNPKYIEGLMKHGYKGATDLANRLSISFQWDATSGVMDDWMYDQYAKKYALDPKMQQWMKKVNPWALQNIAEILLEADQRKMWNANDEMKDELQQLYLSVEGELEDDGDDDE